MKPLNFILIPALLFAPDISSAKISNSVQEQFFEAVRGRNLARAKELHRLGAKINARTADGSTPLLISVGLGDNAMTALLLQEGADPLSLDRKTGAAPLNRAAQSGKIEIAKLLLEHGALIDHQAMLNGHTALLDAIFYRKPALVDALLKNGADIYLKNHLGLTAIDWADRQGIPSIKASIAKRDEEERKRLSSLEPLLSAVRSNRLPDVQAALLSGINPNQKGNDGLTPLMDASRKGYLKIVVELLRAGANPNTPDRVMHSTAGHKAAFFGHTEVLKQLIKAGLDVDAIGPYNGYSALHDAVLQNFPDIVRLLLCSGSRADLRGHDGFTPLELAENLERNEMIDLLKRGCDK